MNDNGNKFNIGICPFQTQIASNPNEKIIRGGLFASQGVPLIKLTCDREKCTLWNSTYHVCSVSATAFLLNQLLEENQNLLLMIGDLKEQSKAQNSKEGCAGKNSEN